MAANMAAHRQAWSWRGTWELYTQQAEERITQGLVTWASETSKSNPSGTLSPKNHAYSIKTIKTIPPNSTNPYEPTGAILFNFFVNVLFFYFSWCHQIPLTTLSIHILSPLLQPPVQNKQKTKEHKSQTKTSQHGVWCVTMCPTVYPFAHTALPANVCCNDTWPGLRLLTPAVLSILDPHCDSSWTSVVALCGGHPAALGQQDWSLHVFQQFIGGVDIGLG